MDEDQGPGEDTLAIYLRLTDTINEHQSRLVWSELFFIALEVVVFFLCVHQIIAMRASLGPDVDGMSAAMLLMSQVIGMAISAYWIAYSMRLQLRLKLRYFQARYLERKLGGAGENIFAGDAKFNKDRTSLESPDGKETINYPRKGALRMDGVFGAAKPRLLSTLMPGLFFILFATLFARVLAELIAVAN